METPLGDFCFALGAACAIVEDWLECSVVERKINQSWRKSRIAARLLLKKEKRPWNARDRALAAMLAEDPGVTNRLIDQAISFLTARQNGYRLLDERR